VAKVRVYELAKELGLTSKQLLGKLNDMGEYVKSASSTLETPVVRRVSDYVTKNSDAPAAKTPKPGKPAPKPPRGGRARAEGVSSAHRLVLPRLGFLYFFYIKWPAVVGPCWRKKQLDIMISKRKFASSQARARKTETHHSAG